MFQLSILKCVSCNTALSGTNKNMVLICKNCHTPNENFKGEVHKVPVTYAASPGGSLQDQVYIPFWVLNTEIEIKSEKIEGGKIQSFIKGEHSFDGNQRIWVVAGDIPDKAAEKLGFQYSKKQPAYSAGKTEDIPEIPVVRDHNEATQIAEYLFLKYEVKRSGTLQSIDYSMKFQGYGLVYLPFEKKGEEYSPLI